MISLSNWRSVRLWESGVERRLRQRHRLWLHGACIGSIVMGVMWASAYLQMLSGPDSLALRYAITLGVGYLAYLVVLRLWAAALIGRGSPLDGSHADVPLPDPGTRVNPAGPARDADFQSGGGGDFGGGGASGDFSAGTELSGSLGDVASGALEAAGSADEGAIVVIPVVAVFLIGCAVFLGAGSMLLLYFGWEVLLTVAVELAFSYVSARTAVRVVREGWLSAAVRLTWKPLLGAFFCAVFLGAMLDYFVPAAHSLPHAIKLIRAGA
ncbi:MAG: hypothetical protein Q8K71_05875 [Polaromonas sp.]|nr:hypothetical protein [Polaromonas sp.]MDP3752761.1 hypothetical protein [Polaromonas sp.]